MPDDQRDTIAFLADGASYGRPGVPVERIDTHVSVLFLVGDRAYKLKRAVTLSYLDYSTLAQRERCCRAELALNRRTAPSLYLAVRAVTRDAAGGLALDGTGEAVEWLVEMRRFDEAGLFDRLAACGALTPALMRDVADAIADFHAAAEPSSGSGGAGGIKAACDDALENLRLAVPTLDAARVGSLAERWRPNLQRISALLERRRDEARVRHCHGDLHLRNICLVDGRPTLFDGIEFSESVAVIDSLYDLAFLLMDLHHRGLGALANLVMNRYLDRTGDAPGLAAMPLFLSLRAAIRAHVSAAAAGRQGDAVARRGLAAEAAAYLELAHRVLDQADPRLVAVGGMSGTGKSTLAQALAPEFAPPPGARIVRSDSLRKRLMGVRPETRLPPEAYDVAANRRVYRALEAEAAVVLAAGFTAVVDAAFLRAEEREAIAHVAAAARAPFAGLWLEAPAQVLAGRLDARRGDASDADAAVMRWQQGLDHGMVDWHRLDTGGDARATSDAARCVLGLSAGA